MGIKLRVFIFTALEVLCAVTLLCAQPETTTISEPEKTLLSQLDEARSIAQNHPDSALNLALETHFAAQEHQSDTLLKRSFFTVGLIHDIGGSSDSALWWYDRGIEYAELQSDKGLKYDLIFSKGLVHYYNQNFASAIQCYDEAIAFWESVNNLDRQSKALNNLAIVFRMRGRHDKAVETYLPSILIKTQLQDTAGLTTSHLNVGNAYYMMDDYDASLEHYHLALKLAEEANDTLSATSVYSGLGRTLVALENFEDAEAYLNLALARMGNKLTLELIGVQLNLAMINRYQNQPEQAIQRLIPYYDAVKKWDRANSLISFEKELAANYAMLGDYPRAYEHHKAYFELFRESSEEKKVRLAEEMQTRFETREKENTILMQELELEKNQREKQALFVGGAFAILTVLIMVVFAVSKVRSNRKLSLEKAKTESLLRDRETLLREIHHRVKNNLQVVSSLLSIQGREITDDKAQRAVNETRNRVQSMALIHQFLYGDQNLSTIDMPQYIEQLSNRLFSTYRVDHELVQLHVDVDPLLLDVDTAIPVGLILNELITNSLKYAFPEGREGNLWVSLKESADVLTLRVKDDGVGVADITPKSTSFGMKLLNAFKQKLEADFEIKSEEGLQIDYHIRKYNKG